MITVSMGIDLKCLFIVCDEIRPGGGAYGGGEFVVGVYGQRRHCDSPFSIKVIHSILQYVSQVKGRTSHEGEGKARRSGGRGLSSMPRK